MGIKQSKIIIGLCVLLGATLGAICFLHTDWPASASHWPTLRLATLSAAIVLGTLGMMGFILSCLHGSCHAEPKESSSQSTDSLETCQNKLKQLEEKLLDQERLVQVGLLTAGIAHEIKNPLNFVTNFSSMSIELFDEFEEIIRPELNKIDSKTQTEANAILSDLKSNIEKITEHGKRAESIVMNMLNQAREEESEQVELKAINPIVEENINLAYHGLRAHDSNFNVKIEKDLDEHCGEIECYAQPIGRVILNIINNGMYAASMKSDFKKNHHPLIKISTKGFTDKVVITIFDNGLGIPKDKMQEIFEPFFTTKPKGQGTGLGLSICHDIIVRDHGGMIEVDSVAGEHTEFKITLPRKAKHKESGL